MYPGPQRKYSCSGPTLVVTLAASVSPEGPDDTQRLNTERFHGTEKRCFFIQRFAGIGTENRRDTEQRCAPWGFMDKAGEVQSKAV